MDGSSNLKIMMGAAASRHILHGLACSCSAARYIVQRQKYGRLLLEDWIHIAALLQLTACVLASSVVSMYMPVSQPDDAIRDSAFAAYTAFRTFYCTTVFTGKAVFLALYWRVFGVNRVFRLLWLLTTIATACTGVAVTLAQFFPCDGSIAAYSRRSCESNFATSPIAIFTMTCNVTTDILIMALPLGMITKMRVRRGKKVRLVPIFLLGTATVTIDILGWMPQILANGVLVVEVSDLFLILEPPTVVIIASLPAILFSGRQRPSHSQIHRGSQSAVGHGPVTGHPAARNMWLHAGRRGTGDAEDRDLGLDTVETTSTPHDRFGSPHNTLLEADWRRS